METDGRVGPDPRTARSAAIAMLVAFACASMVARAQDEEPSFDTAGPIDDPAIACSEGCRPGRVVRRGDAVAREQIVTSAPEMPGGRAVVSRHVVVSVGARSFYVGIRGATGSRCAGAGASIVEESTTLEAIALRDVLDGPEPELVLVVDHRIERAHDRYAIVCTLDRDPPMCTELALSRRAPRFLDRDHVDLGHGALELAFPAAILDSEGVPRAQ